MPLYMVSVVTTTTCTLNILFSLARFFSPFSSPSPHTFATSKFPIQKRSISGSIRKIADTLCAKRARTHFERWKLSATFYLLPTFWQFNVVDIATVCLHNYPNWCVINFEGARKRLFQRIHCFISKSHSFHSICPVDNDWKLFDTM